MKKVIVGGIAAAVIIIASPVFADGITFSGASDVTADATSSAGAYVPFTVTASDASGTVPVSCDPAAGTFFALGTKEVDCSASDASTTATTTFNVIVKDTTPPSITPPADQTFATSTFPATPTLTPATATDAIDPNPAITYSPHSFDLGTTKVIWTATDSSGNSAATSSLVIITDDATSSNATSTDPSSDSTSSDATLSITPPSDQTFTATSFPATPTLVYAKASDDTDANPIVTVSTTTFAAGTTTVTWTATDSSGNTATTTSDVGVFLNENISVDVPATCTVTDTDGVQHIYTAASSTAYVAICAVQAAIDDKTLANADFSDQYPSLGLFITGLDGVNADPNSEYWALFQNGGYASLGLSELPVAAGDSIMLQLQDFSGDDLGDQVTFAINSLVATSSDATTTAATSTGSISSSGSSPTQTSSGGGGGGGFAHVPFNVTGAISYLSSQQTSDGSIDDSTLDTDWSALAYAAFGTTVASSNLARYLQTTSPIFGPVTDYERHAMALEAMDINPYTGSPTDTITPIVQAFDGTHIGDPSLVSDDIFALPPLLHAGYSASDPIIQKATAFILSQQGADGSWDGVDMTAAAVQALEEVSALPGVTDSLQKARAYLAAQQQGDGGFGNSSATSWAMQAIAAMGQQQINWTSPSGYDPQDYLSSQQEADGGMSNTPSDAALRAWATAYAIPAVLNEPWGALLHSFPKPANSAALATGIANTSANATSSALAATSSDALATSTAPIATTTPFVATSTIIAATSTAPTVSTTSETLAYNNPQTSDAAPKAPRPSPSPATAQATTSGATSTAQFAAAAEAAAAPSPSFFGDIWHAVVSFFSHLL